MGNGTSAAAARICEDGSLYKVFALALNIYLALYYVSDPTPMIKLRRRSAGDRLPYATESCTAPCTTLPGVQERSHRA